MKLLHFIHHGLEINVKDLYFLGKLLPGKTRDTFFAGVDVKGECEISRAVKLFDVSREVSENILMYWTLLRHTKTHTSEHMNSSRTWSFSVFFMVTPGRQFHNGIVLRERVFFRARQKVIYLVYCEL